MGKTKAQRTEEATDRDDALTALRGWVLPGSKLYTIVRSVSRDGMSRSISVLKAHDQPGSQEIDRLDWHVSVVLDLKLDTKNGGVRIHGVGMDMGFEVIYQLSRALHPEYECLGEGARCPSNEHVNHPRPPYGGTHTDGYALRQQWI
jgi:hypothetical protein